MHIFADFKWYLQVTTFSRLLTAPDLKQLEQLPHTVELLSLQQFETEQSFLKKIRFAWIFTLAFNLLHFFGGWSCDYLIFMLSDDFVQNCMICVVLSL